MSEYIDDKMPKNSQVTSNLVASAESAPKIAHIQGPEQFYEKNFTRMDFLKTAHKFGKGYIPVRK